MTISSKAKAATLIGVVITIVTLALVTALVVVNMMPVQKAAASCVINPKNGVRACSGNGGSQSLVTPNGNVHNALSQNSRSISQNVGTSAPVDQSSSHNYGGLGNCADTT